MGMPRAARRSTIKATRMDPEDKWARADLQERTGDCKLFTQGDRVWESAELIARGRWRDALNLLGRERSIRVRQARARAYAALGDRACALQEWKYLANMQGAVTMSLADNFFVRDLLWHSAEFWRTIRSIAPRAEHTWWLPEGLYKAVPMNRLKAENPLRQLVRQYARFHLARIEADGAKISKLGREYPNWKKAVRLARGDTLSWTWS